MVKTPSCVAASAESPHLAAAALEAIAFLSVSLVVHTRKSPLDAGFLVEWNGASANQQFAHCASHKAIALSMWSLMFWISARIS